MTQKDLVYSEYNSIDKEWDYFVEKYDITNPHKYISHAEVSDSCVHQLQIGLSNFCNFDCVFCYNHVNSFYNYRSASTLNKMDLVQFVKQCSPLKEIVFTNYGEPFIYPSLFYVMEALKNDVKGFSFNTNGSMLSEEILDRLSMYPLNRLGISIDGSDSETYEKLRKNGCFKTLKENVSRLCALEFEELYINSVLFKENAESVLGIPLLCKELGVKNLYLQHLFNHPRTLDRNLHPLTTKETFNFCLRFIEECEKHEIDTNFSREFLPHKYAMIIHEQTQGRYYKDIDIYKNPCVIAMRSIMIDPEWNFGSCCYYEPMSHQNGKESLSNMVNTDSLKKLRAMQILGIYPHTCRSQCHMVSKKNRDISFEKYKISIEKYYLENRINWKQEKYFPRNEKIILWPFGKLSKELLEKGFFNNKKLVAIVDNSKNDNISNSNKVRIISPKDIFQEQYDSLIITSEAFVLEILLECLKMGIFNNKNVYSLGSNNQLKRAIFIR